MSLTITCGHFTSQWLCWVSGAFTQRIVFLGCRGCLSQHKVSEGSLSSFLPCILPCQGLGHTALGPGWRGSSALITTKLLCLTSMQALWVEVSRN